MPGAWLSQLVRTLRRDPPADGSSDAELLARFARDRDEAAFELLVWRHGGMVLSACRRALGHEHDAEDAFQATFLVLARKAGSVGRGAALPAWLHRVAVRISARAAKRRRGAAPLVGEVAAPAAADPVAGAEVAALLDAEIDRLPDRLRRAVVLCYLEGLTAAEAGVRLGCPTGTVESRLAAARRALRVRLARRGVTTPVGVFAFVGGEAVLAPEAVAALARAGRAFVTGGPMAEVSDTPVRLAKGELAMGVKRLAAGVGAVGLAVAVSAGVGWALDPTPKPDEPTAKAPAPPPKVADAKPADPPAKVKAEAWPFVRQLSAQSGRLVAVAPGGRSFVFLSGQDIYGIDLTGQEQTFYVSPPNRVLDAAVSPDGKWLATAEGVNGVKIRELPSGKSVEPLWPSGGLPARKVAFTPDGAHLLVLCWDPAKTSGARHSARDVQLSVWNVNTRKEVGRSLDPSWDTAHPTLPPGGQFALLTESVYSAPVKDTTDPSVTTQELTGLRFRLLDPLDPARDRSGRVAVNNLGPPGPEPVSPDGKSVALAAVTPKGGSLFLYDLATGDRRFELGSLRRPIHVVSFSPDGRWVAAASRRDGTPLAAPTEVVIWEVATGKEVARRTDKEANRDYAVLRFSPDGSFLVAQDAVGGLTIWGHPPQPEAVKAVAPEPAKATPSEAVPDRFAALVKELSAAGVSDARRVEAVFLAALGRLPTDTETKALAAQLGRQADKGAAVRDLLDTLVGTAEFKAHAAALGKLAK
ncbi:MAG: sigma-70 family RNA polymerase sigma factor [Gemmataceae bacterium]|nr:sigma-70 family RNA polymerase sigma factor [Gemmataceae bacterium]